MDTTGIVDPDKTGTLQLRAQQLKQGDKSTLSAVVDELAFWFAARARGEH